MRSIQDSSGIAACIERFRYQAPTSSESRSPISKDKFWWLNTSGDNFVQTDPAGIGCNDEKIVDISKEDNICSYSMEDSDYSNDHINHKIQNVKKEAHNEFQNKPYYRNRKDHNVVIHPNLVEDQSIMDSGDSDEVNDLDKYADRLLRKCDLLLAGYNSSNANIHKSTIADREKWTNKALSHYDRPTKNESEADTFVESDSSYGSDSDVEVSRNSSPSITSSTADQGKNLLTAGHKIHIDTSERMQQLPSSVENRAGNFSPEEISTSLFLSTDSWGGLLSQQNISDIELRESDDIWQRDLIPQSAVESEKEMYNDVESAPRTSPPSISEISDVNNLVNVCQNSSKSVTKELSSVSLSDSISLGMVALPVSCSKSTPTETFSKNETECIVSRDALFNDMIINPNNEVKILAKPSQSIDPELSSPLCASSSSSRKPYSKGVASNYITSPESPNFSFRKSDDQQSIFLYLSSSSELEGALSTAAEIRTIKCNLKEYHEVVADEERSRCDDETVTVANYDIDEVAGTESAISKESEIYDESENKEILTSSGIDQHKNDHCLTDVQVSPFLCDELTRLLWTRLCVVRAQIADALEAE